MLVALGIDCRFCCRRTCRVTAVLINCCQSNAELLWQSGIPQRTGFAGEVRFVLLNDVRFGERKLPRMVDRCAMLALPRERFVPAHLAAFAYIDEDVPLGEGRFLIEPVIIARLVQLAAIVDGERALVVGAGTGYGAWPTSVPRSSATSRSPCATSRAGTTRSSASRCRT